MELPAPRPSSLLEQTLADRAAGASRPLSAFIYARRSYDPNGIARAIGDQTHEGRATCDRNGWSVAGEFADPDNSASRHSRKQRPDYDAMVQRVRAGECDVIVSWESVRLSRDITVFTRLADLCEQNGVLLCLNGTIYDMRNSQQRFFAQMTVLQGGYEADTIRDRNLRTMAGLAREGRPTGFTPFGFKREYDPGTGALIRQYADEATAPIVKELTRRVAGGASLLSLAREMVERGVPTPRPGAEWHPMTVRALVRRPTNIGKRVHQGRVVGDAAWEGIVGEADYYAALKILSDPGRRTQKDTAVKYLLSGITYGRCGHRLYPITGGGRKRKRYGCKTCFSCAIPMDVFDDLVCSAVLAYVEDPAFAAALAPGDPDEEARAAIMLADALEAELEEARRLVGTVANGRPALSVADFAAISAKLTAQIDAARAQAQDMAVPETLRRFAGLQAREVWASSELPERRALVRELVVVTLNPAGAGKREITPGRVSWEWRW